MLRGYVPEYRACGDGVPSVKKSPINQRISPFLEQNRCVFLFPQSEDISRGLPQGDRLWGTGDIHFGERILLGKRNEEQINKIIW